MASSGRIINAMTPREPQKDVLEYLHDNKYINEHTKSTYYFWSNHKDDFNSFKNNEYKIFDFLQSPRGQYYLRHFKPGFLAESIIFPLSKGPSRVGWYFENQHLLDFLDGWDKVEVLNNPTIFLYLMSKSSNDSARCIYTPACITSLNDGSARSALNMINIEADVNAESRYITRMAEDDPTGTIQAAIIERNELAIAKKEKMQKANMADEEGAKMMQEASEIAGELDKCWKMGGQDFVPVFFKMLSKAEVTKERRQKGFQLSPPCSL